MLQDFGLLPGSLEIVPDVQAWCHANGVEEKNPFRTAKCFCHWAEGACHIVLAETISDEQISGAKDGMECSGFVEEVHRLGTDRKYLVHLMLHEIACHVLKTAEQEPRDAWAFSEMERYAA